jgi:hypothetical protein
VKIEKLLPKEYKLECQGAKRGKKKGRAAGGIIAGFKLGIKEKRQEKGKEGGCMERKMVENNDKIQQRDEDNKKRCGRCNKRKHRRMCAHGRVLQRENRTMWKMQRERD